MPLQTLQWVSGTIASPKKWNGWCWKRFASSCLGVVVEYQTEKYSMGAGFKCGEFGT